MAPNFELPICNYAYITEAELIHTFPHHSPQFNALSKEKSSGGADRNFLQRTTPTDDRSLWSITITAK